MRLAALILITLVTNLSYGAGLDGTTFQIVLTDEDGKKLPAEQLIFAGGNLGAPAIRERYGFADGPYTVTPHAQGAELQATLTSTKHGTVTYSGIITKAGAITGSRTWVKPKRDPIVHTFAGERQVTDE